jgi:uncharacterized membrane protein
MNNNIVVIVSVTLMLFGCTDKPKFQVKEGVTFTKDILPITSTSCAKCHFEDERDYRVYTNAYNRRQLIYQRVYIEKSMPLGSTLTDEQRALFRDWYNQGSKE